MKLLTVVTDFFTDLLSTTSEEGNSPEASVPGTTNPETTTTSVGPGNQPIIAPPVN